MNATRIVIHQQVIAKSLTDFCTETVEWQPSGVVKTGAGQKLSVDDECVWFNICEFYQSECLRGERGEGWELNQTAGGEIDLKKRVRDLYFNEPRLWVSIFGNRG